MRLCYCYECKTLSKIDDFTGNNPDHDVLLQDWIDRHLHGIHVDDHKGGRVFTMDSGNVEQSEAMSAIERAAVEEVRAELQKVNAEVFEYRDELRTDAVVCHQRHGQPSWPGKPCIDFRSDSKIVGRKNVPKKQRQWLCLYCPYQSSVTVSIRADRGDYRQN